MQYNGVSEKCKVYQADLRDLSGTSTRGRDAAGAGAGATGAEAEAEAEGAATRRQAAELGKQLQERFELVTGTPPYFNVEWSESGEASTGFGALPSCRQSAPARYEFRGGVEDYCQAGAHCMTRNGIFVVCEGGLQMNEERVTAGAHRAVCCSSQ